MVTDTQGAMVFLELGGMAVKYLNIFVGMDLTDFMHNWFWGHYAKSGRHKHAVSAVFSASFR